MSKAASWSPVICRWGETFADEVVAAAMIDRLVRHAEVFTLTEQAYRTRPPRTARQRPQHRLARHHPR
jgi:IstB-like ATP binding protein